MSGTNEQQGVNNTPTVTHQYRGQPIYRHESVPIGRRGRYTWSGRPFAQLRLAKQAIDDHYRQHTAGSTRS